MIASVPRDFTTAAGPFALTAISTFTQPSPPPLRTPLILGSTASDLRRRASARSSPGLHSPTITGRTLTGSGPSSVDPVNVYAAVGVARLPHLDAADARLEVLHLHRGRGGDHALVLSIACSPSRSRTSSRAPRRRCRNVSRNVASTVASTVIMPLSPLFAISAALIVGSTVACLYLNPPRFRARFSLRQTCRFRLFGNHLVLGRGEAGRAWSRRRSVRIWRR